MTQEREFGWDDTIVNDGNDFNFILLPEGDYNFTVGGFERTRFAGSANLPACNQAKVELVIHSPQGDVKINHNLFLHTKTEGLLSAFFGAIGQKKKGEPLKMNWNAVIGAKGRCILEHNRYMSKGEERVNNQVKRFYSYDEYLKHAVANSAIPQGGGGWQQPPQSGQQAPFPPAGQQGGGWQAGQF